MVLHNSKDTFHFGSDGRFLALSALDLCSGSIGVVLALRWTTIDFVTNSLSGLITGNDLGVFLCSEIAAVSVYNLLLLRSEVLPSYRHRANFQCVHNASFVATPTWALYPKCHVLPFLAECASGSRFLSLFLVEDGASMKVESTIVPFLRIKLRSVSKATTCAKKALLQIILNQQVAESPQRISVRHLIAGLNAAEV